jgi:penicillin-binding protein 1C
VPADGCGGDSGEDAQAGAPLIVAPLRGVRHTVRVNKPEPLVLRAEAAAGAHAIYWFADDALIGQAAPGEGLAWMPGLAEPGRRYLLRAVDDRGRAESREVIIDLAP